jgi:hypothetical protein
VDERKRVRSGLGIHRASRDLTRLDDSGRRNGSRRFADDGQRRRVFLGGRSRTRGNCCCEKESESTHGRRNVHGRTGAGAR